MTHYVVKILESGSVTQLQYDLLASSPEHAMAAAINEAKKGGHSFAHALVRVFERDSGQLRNPILQAEVTP